MRMSNNSRFKNSLAALVAALALAGGGLILRDTLNTSRASKRVRPDDALLRMRRQYQTYERYEADDARKRAKAHREAEHAALRH